MSAPLLTISVDLATGTRRLVCGSCGADSELGGEAGSPTRSAAVTVFVTAHAACHRPRPAPAQDDDGSNPVE